MTFEELEGLEPSEFSKLWEKYWDDTPSERGLKYWADYCDFLAAYRAGQKEMRGRAAGYYEKWKDVPTPLGTDGLLRGILALPLEGDDE